LVAQDALQQALEGFSPDRAGATSSPRNCVSWLACGHRFNLAKLRSSARPRSSYLEGHFFDLGHQRLASDHLAVLRCRGARDLGVCSGSVSFGRVDVGMSQDRLAGCDALSQGNASRGGMAQAVR